MMQRRDFTVALFILLMVMGLLIVLTKDKYPTGHQVHLAESSSVFDDVHQISTSDDTAGSSIEEGSSNFENVPLDVNFTMAADVTKVIHYPDKSEIVVFLKPGAHCEEPLLIGRLSGPALIMVENWKRTVRSNGITIAGTYKSPLAREFFLEIIAIFCNDPYTRLVPDLKPFDFAHVCIDDPDHNRITVPGAKIIVTRATDKRPGYWKHFPHKPKYNSSYNPAEEPLFTRYQPPSCWPEPEDPKELAFCHEKTTTKPFDEYKWFWRVGKNETIGRLRPKEPLHVCFVGWSHSNHTLAFFPKFISNETGITVTSSWVSCAFPGDIIDRVPKQAKQLKCNKLIIGLYQHPGGAAGGFIPEQFKVYYDDFTAAIPVLKKELPGVDLYLRSPHVNPLMGNVGKCPPKDGRNPAVMYGYAEINKRIAREQNIEYLDDLFINDPLWDSKPDYNHLGQTNGVLDTGYLVLRSMGYLKEWEEDACGSAAAAP